jgi:hypothetical protein
MSYDLTFELLAPDGTRLMVFHGPSVDWAAGLAGAWCREHNLSTSEHWLNEIIPGAGSYSVDDDGAGHPDHNRAA